jgi:NTE family protein
MENKKQRPKIALSLGGGGSKTFAHLGVLDAFEKHNIPIDFLVTCSAASVIGLLYNIGISSEEIRKEFKRKRKWLYIARRSIFRRVLEKFIKEKSITDIKYLRIPISIVTVDLKTGKEIIFEDGDPLLIPLGSSAYPGIWKPVKYKEYELIDGGVLNPDPANIARSKVGRDGLVINVTLKMEFIEESTETRLSTILKSLYLLSLKYRNETIEKNSDIIIVPSNGLKINFRDWRETFVGYFSNNKIEKNYQKGFEEAERKIIRIKELINYKKT